MDSLKGAANLWATPQARDVKNPTAGDQRAARKQEQGWTVDLNDQSALWQTPQVDSFHSRGGDRVDEQGLDQQARLWPTPDASAINEGENPETWEQRRQRLKLKGYNGNGAGTPLTIAATRWASSHPDPETQGPGARSYPPNRTLRRLSLEPSLSESTRTLLDCWIYRRWSRQSKLIRKRDEVTGVIEVREQSAAPFVRPSIRRKLNVRFVTALMGLPPNWTSVATACGHLEMESFLLKARLHLSLWLNERGLL